MLPDGSPARVLDLARSMPDPQLLEGVEVVFHLAGIAHQQAEASAYGELNEVATLRLARLCAAAGVRCFVFLSSVKAMGPAAGEAERGEQDVTAPLDPYGLSKWRAENQLRTEFSDAAMAVVILRPALVYGPGAKGNLALLAKAVKAGLPRPPSLGGRSMVALDDLVELMCLLARDAAPGVHTWIASDGQCYTTRFIYDQLRLAAGKGTGLAWLPTVGWRLAAGLLDILRPGGGESMFDKLFATELYSNAALLASTSWRPRCRFADAAASLMATGEVVV